MRICVYMNVLVLMFLSHWCYGYDNVFKNDTAWIVNYEFSPVERDTFHLTLNIPEKVDSLLDYKYVRVFWGNNVDGNPAVSELLEFNAGELELKHKYPAGIYTLVLKYYKTDPGVDLSKEGEKEVMRVVFNQQLTGSISIKGDDGCIESGVDTFSVYLSNHKTNPPGTKYTLEVRTDAPGRDPWKIEPVDASKITDSAKVIFSGPTGLFGADIRFRMEYREPGSRLVKRGETVWSTVHVYKTPDLNDIFSFQDSLRQGETILDLKNIEVCTGQEMSEIRYDSLVNVKYMYMDGLPMYNSRYNFEMEYFRKDSVRQKDWVNVTQDTSMVDTTKMIFKYPGFYKIRMMAFNECGLDSLHTDSVISYNEKRYIQVFQGGIDVLRCDQDTICGMPEDGVRIKFMDLGKRFEWDPAPEYKFAIIRNLNGSAVQDTVELAESPVQTLYKDGHPLAGVGEHTGCDSTSLDIKLAEIGTYTITITRSRYCDPPISYTHVVTIGDVPGLPVDTLWKHLGTEKDVPIHLCDTLKYTLPEILIDTNNMDIDSIRWRMVRKTRKDTLYQIYGEEKIFVFDSIGDHLNYMTLDVHNFCGWSRAEKAELYTDTRPKVFLMRDSVAKNDSLCLGITYDYHWGGTLPSQYEITGEWTEKVQVNGSDVNPMAGSPVLITSTRPGEPETGKVKFYQENEKIFEIFQIRNLQNLNCAEELVDSVVVLAMPHTVNYDTVRYCEDFTALHAGMLFDTDAPEFKYAYWKWNDNPVLNENLPVFTLNPGGADSLFVRTGNSSGCYLDNKVVFIPQVKPDFKLKEKDKTVCADKVIGSDTYAKDYVLSSNVKDGVSGVDGMTMRVYQDKTDEHHLLYDLSGAMIVNSFVTLDHESADTVRLIYKINNEKVTPEFGDCVLLDTVSIKVWKSVLQIEGGDTLRDIVSMRYDFAHPGTAVRIDTADLKDQKILWKSIDGDGNFVDPNDLKTVYTLGTDDKLRDSLLFELSGFTPCDEGLKDTLVVYLPKEELKAYSDTICSNNPGYLLWDPENGKTSGKYLNTETLEWRLLGNGGRDLGALIPAAAKGKNVKYIPGTDAWMEDTVKIEVKAWNMFDASATGRILLDTVFLKVNRAPRNVYPDTLYLKAGDEADRLLTFDDIGVFAPGFNSFADSYSVGTDWMLIKSEGRNAGFRNNGKEFYIGMPPAEENYAADLKMLLTGAKGCGVVIEDLVLVGVMPPKVELNNFDLCDGESVPLNTAYEVKALDWFTALTWEHNGTGDFTADYASYVTGVNDTVNAISLSASKNFTLYDNTPAEYSGAGATGQVNLFRKPDFHLKDFLGNELRYDTLCFGEQNYHYERAWVDANYSHANYSDAHLTTRKSIGLTGNFPDFTLQDGVSEALLIVSADFGGCKKWEDIADTISLSGLRQMTGNFDIPTFVCAGSAFPVTGITADPLSRGITWSATGAVIDQTNPLQPVVRANSVSGGTVSMIVVPPHACPPEQVMSKSFGTKEQPFLLLEDMTRCKGRDFIIHFEDHPQIQSIDWTVNGRKFATTTKYQTSVVYRYQASDVPEGGTTLQITGEITPESPCTDKVLSNVMTVTLQEPPVISGLLEAKVCQGDSLDLTPDIVTVGHAGNVSWDMNGSAGFLKDMEIVNTRYVPGEISGQQTLKLMATGLSGCATVSKEIKIDVQKSELPQISIPDILCVQDEITFEHIAAEQPVGAAGKWYVNGAEKASTWYRFKHRFETGGEYDLKFTTTYNGICPRSVSETILINALPQVDFTSQPDSIVGSGKEVVFTSITPGTIVNHSWNFHGNGVKVSEMEGVYTHRYDLVGVSSLLTPVTLTVTDGNGCTASKSKGMKVVAAPKAEFSIESFDECSGEIGFKNLSEGENAEYLWILSSQLTTTDTVPEGVVFQSAYRDTLYYITLKVENEGGESEYKDSVTVISKLAPKYIVAPDNTGCPGKEFNFSNRTKGEADNYSFNWGDLSPEQNFPEFKYTVPVPHLFNNTEHYAVKFGVVMTVSNVCYTASFKDSVLVYPNNVDMNFVPEKTRICFGDEIVFRNESFGFGPDVQTWWYFGTNALPESNNSHEVVHRFTRPGSYPVKLVMTDRCSSDTSEIVMIQVLGDMSLDFGMSSGPYCSGQQIEMKVFPELKDKFTNLRWDFGDGYPESGLDSLMKRYNNAGDYKVVLKGNSVSEGNCPVTVQEKNIRVNSTPFAAITPVTDISGCAPLLVEKLARAGTGNELVFWDFKNGETSTEAVVNKITYREAGKYQVLLQLTSQEGCVDTASKLIVVRETPKPFFEVADSMFCSADGNIAIGLKNQTPRPEESSFEWSYDALPAFSRQQEPGVLELTNKFGPVQLKLSANHNATGCSAQFTKEIHSGHFVKVGMNVDTAICFDVPLHIQSQSEFADEILWEMGDGFQETRESFTYTYEEPGQYWLKLFVSNATGCQDSLKKLVRVYPVPVAGFSYEEDNSIMKDLGLPLNLDAGKLPKVKNGGIRFSNHSSVDPYSFADADLRSSWDFGDETEISHVKHPEHRYPNNGQYLIKLLVETKYGCTDSVSEVIYIEAVKGLFIPNAFAPGTGVDENPGVALFQPKGIGLLQYRIKVYDAWGTCVWTSDKLQDGHPAEAWDGTFKGRPLPKDTYLWEVDAVFTDGSVWTGEKGKTKGEVLLIR